ncbi:MULTISPECIES: hypothetical protein [unclassified Pseudanabaena]|uniref:hypothetical protein n=1 Tax=unclassified Pseudanabaena TaxID=2593292 RepID=UPI000AA16C57|nr:MULTISPECIES: hypothetical protein [unclassified Pseudanabaena]
MPEEADFPAIFAEPMEIVVKALQTQTKWDDMLRHLPDISLASAQDYGLMSVNL